jgi:uncharacterized protein
MPQSTDRRALIVRGGWDGHHPVEATERFTPFLSEQGFTVDVQEDLEVYAHAEDLARYALIVQCWTFGALTDEQAAGLCAAVESGTGFAGWHGGIVDAFRASPEYLQMTGGQFATHPGGIIEHEVHVDEERCGHPIVAGLPSRWTQTTEQYWLLTDPGNDVLAHTRFRPDDGTPWHREIRIPAVWTRQWGQGRVFVSTIGHHPTDLDVPPVRTLTERGLLWAAWGETPPGSTS